MGLLWQSEPHSAQLPWWWAGWKEGCYDGEARGEEVAFCLPKGCFTGWLGGSP